MLKFKMSLLFNNLKFRVAMIVLIIAAIVAGIIFIPKNKAGNINTNLSSNDIISQACKLIGKGYWVNPNNGDGFEDGWGHGVTNGYLWGGSAGTRKYGKDFSLAKLNSFTSFDCGGMVYYTLTSLGCTTSGFSFQNPVPVDPTHWYNNSNPTMTYKGKTSNVKVLKSGVSVEDMPYYKCADGSEIPSGSIVVSSGSTLNKNYSDHAWIYLGDFETTSEKEVAKILINDMNVDANLLINGDVDGDFSIKTYVNGLGKRVPVIQKTDDKSTHWRIECTADTMGYGVYINNGDPTSVTAITDPNSGKTKVVGPIYAFQLANESERTVEGKYTVELYKVDENGELVYSEADFEINGKKKSTNQGKITIASDVVVTDVNQVDTYTIKETKAPKDHVMFNGTITLKVKMCKKGNQLVLRENGITLDAGKENSGVKFEVKGSTVKVYVQNTRKPFDLALRKYISKINGKELEVSREPVINEQSIKMLEKTGTASYYHQKNSLQVRVGDEVEYTLRVYNEGEILGHAKQIVDYLPEGLSFVKLSDDNSKQYSTNTKPGSKEVVIGFSGNDNIKSLMDFIGKSDIKVTSDYYQEVKLICKVENTEKTYITNRAEIINYGYSKEDAKGISVWKDARGIGNVDRDSVQNTIRKNLNLDNWYKNAKENTYKDKNGEIVIDSNYYPGEQDDDDFETLELLSGKYKIIIKKVDATDENKTLQGAYFSVKGSQVTTEKEVGPTGSNGEVTVLEGVKINNENQIDEYTIKETKAPAEYKLYSGEVKVKVATKLDGNNFVIDANNTKVDGKSVKYSIDKDNTTITIVVPNTRKDFDLSLRKFITEVNGEKLNESREPQVDVSKLASGESTTATYNHPKNPVDVNTTDIVTYTIRVYNEGELDGYASKIMDDIPQGLEFVPAEYDKEGKPINTNAVYKWTIYREMKDGEVAIPENMITYNDKNYVVTDKVEEADVIVTDYLSKEYGTSNLLKAFDPKTMKELDYRDVKVSFKVIEPTTSDRIITNYAQITDNTDSTGRPIVDRDSTPNKWIDEEDDQDIEKIKVRYFDLSLLKWVTKAIVYENGVKTVTETNHTPYDNPEPVVKVDLKNTNLNNVEVKFEYSIRITNEGEIAGYAKEISDYIPDGLKFVASDNPQWTEKDGKVVTRALENTLLQPGEHADVTITLTWINGKNNLGLKTNVAEISEDYNQYGTPDIDSTPNNRVPGEDDIDDAPVMLAIRTGKPVVYAGLTISVLAILTVGVVVIKKRVL